MGELNRSLDLFNQKTIDMLLLNDNSMTLVYINTSHFHLGVEKNPKSIHTQENQRKQPGRILSFCNHIELERH